MIVIGPDFAPPPAEMLGPLQIVVLVLVLAVILERERGESQLGIFGASTTYTLTSWYRTPQRNAQVGGLPGSLHTLGLAIDVVVDTPFFSASTDAIQQTLLQRAWSKLGPIFQGEREDDHVHLELDARGA